MKPRKIFHADINNCFASIEIQHRPELRGLPVAVGGDAEKRHGVILAKSNEAKAFGVQTGEAIWEAKQKCPDLVIVPPHYTLYLQASRAFRAILADYTDLLEPFGLDEMWGDITHSWHLFADSPETLVDEIRTRVHRELGITVSIGLADNKIFAKLGSDYKKPDACTVITKENYRDILWPLSAQDLLGVGRATKAKLNRYGLVTIGDIARTDPALLKSWFHKPGLYLHAYANGRDTSPVRPAGHETAVKSVGNSVTTPRDLENTRDCLLVFQHYAEVVAERLRELNLQCRTVQISLRDNGLTRFERQLTLPWPTHLSSEILDASMRLLAANYDFRKPLRSVGIRASNLVPSKHNAQLSLFQSEAEIARMRRENLEFAVDDIRRRYGRFAIRRASLLSDRQLGNLNPLPEGIVFDFG
ncbi:MAG: DNA polymerase IV [Clostridiales bacterium]|nr:DNA polymerase IV [Clostridiales bacterium]